jgi:hypothetical protein
MYVRHQNAKNVLLETILIELLLCQIFSSLVLILRIQMNSFSSFAGCYLVKNMVSDVHFFVRPTPCTSDTIHNFALAILVMYYCWKYYRFSSYRTPSYQ